MKSRDLKVFTCKKKGGWVLGLFVMYSGVIVGCGHSEWKHKIHYQSLSLIYNNLFKGNVLTEMLPHCGSPSSLRPFAHLETSISIYFTEYSKKSSNSLSGMVQEYLSLLDFLCMVDEIVLFYIFW